MVETTPRSIRSPRGMASPVTKHQYRRPSALGGGDVKKTLEGYVEKQSKKGIWQRRYFVIQNHYLVYYEDDKKNPGTGGQIDLNLAALIRQENKQIVLHLNDKTKYRLRFETQSMAEEWAARLKHVHIHASRTPTGKKSAPIKPPKQSPPRPPNSVGKAGRVAAFGWFFLVGIASTLSLGSVLPMPTMSLWLLKVGVLSGVLHATLLKTYVSMAVLSLTGYFYTKGTKVNEKYMLACGFALAAIVVHSTPMVANLALASRVPGNVVSFLDDAGFDGASVLETSPVSAFSLSQYLVDYPCAVSNGSTTSEPTVVVYKEYNDAVESAMREIEDGTDPTGEGNSLPKVVREVPATESSVFADWTGFGNLYDNHESGSLKVAIFRPEPSSAKPLKKLPVVISLHGGGWYSGSMYEGLQCYLPQLLDQQWAVVAAEYRLGSRGWRGRHMLLDVIDAIQWVRKTGSAKYGLNPDSIVLMGGSAGAYLALIAGYSLNAREKRQVVKGVISRYGAVDLKAAYATPSRLHGLGVWNERRAIEHITGGTPATVGQEYDFLSPLSHIGDYTPPTIILHCRQDEFYSASTHADSLVSALSEANVPNMLISPGLHSHGCDIGSTVPFQLLRYAVANFVGALSPSK